MSGLRGLHVPTFGMPLTITAVVHPWVGVGREDGMAEYQHGRRPFEANNGDAPGEHLAWPGEPIPGSDDVWPQPGQALLCWRRHPCKPAPVIAIRTVTRSDGEFDRDDRLRRSRRHELVEVHLQPPFKNGRRVVLAHPPDLIHRTVAVVGVAA